MINSLHPTIQKGAYLDDRNFRGSVDELIKLDRTIRDFDAAAGLTTQHDKTEYAMTNLQEKKQLQKLRKSGVLLPVREPCPKNR